MFARRKYVISKRTCRAQAPARRVWTVSSWTTDPSPVPEPYGPDSSPGNGDGWSPSDWDPEKWLEFIFGIVGTTIQTVQGVVRVQGPSGQTGCFVGNDGNTYCLAPNDVQPPGGGGGDGGDAATDDKTLLYLGGALLAVLALKS